MKTKQNKKKEVGESHLIELLKFAFPILFQNVTFIIFYTSQSNLFILVDNL